MIGLLLAGCSAASSQPLAPVDTVPALGSSAPDRGEEPCRGLPVDQSFVVVTLPAAGASVVPPFDVTGCSRTFEGTLTWRLLDRMAVVVAEGIAAGGSSDGPAPFRFRVAAPAAVGLHHLEVDEPRVTDEGFAPGRTVLPLVLGPSTSRE